MQERQALGYVDRYWWSNDGLRLHYRDYAAERPTDPALSPILCLPGLTRNARDFHTVATRLSATRRVISVDLRGRDGLDEGDGFRNAGLQVGQRCLVVFKRRNGDARQTRHHALGRITGNLHLRGHGQHVGEQAVGGE